MYLIFVVSVPSVRFCTGRLGTGAGFVEGTLGKGGGVEVQYGEHGAGLELVTEATAANQIPGIQFAQHAFWILDIPYNVRVSHHGSSRRTCPAWAVFVARGIFEHRHQFWG